MEQTCTKQTAKGILQEINNDISWFVFAKTYMNKSYSWFIKKLKGYDGNGQASDFTDEEREELRNGLFDLAERIRRSAERL